MNPLNCACSAANPYDFTWCKLRPCCQAKAATCSPPEISPADHLDQACTTGGDTKSSDRNDSQTPGLATTQTEAPYKYVGNSFSKKFHRPWCPFQQVMNAHHAVFFQFRKDAIEAGFLPCRYCLPPITKQVRCVLLKRESGQHQAEQHVQFQSAND
jgi:hypothetical protein